MRITAIFVLAAGATWLVPACGPPFTSTGADAGASSGAAGRIAGVGGSGGSSAGGSAGGDFGTAGAGEGESGSAGMSEAGAAGAACSDPTTDCPPLGTSCAEAVCLAGRCASSVAAPRSPCDDHGGQLCLAGKCVECSRAADCPAQATACKVSVCKPETHTCGATNRALGFACKENGGLVCDGAGVCVSTHCADGVQDVDETDVDCGGSCSAKCKDTGPQQKCRINGDCQSGSCAGSPLLCQPLPACAASCTASCASCVIPGQVGTCAKLPPGVDDASNFCLGQAVCDSDGACVAAQNKGHFGDPCTQDPDCFNGACGAGFCRLRNGDACAEDAACKSGRCLAKVCAACGDGADCASGKCNAGVCLFPGGYPCGVGTDCAGQSAASATKPAPRPGANRARPSRASRTFAATATVRLAPPTVTARSAPPARAAVASRQQAPTAPAPPDVPAASARRRRF